MRWKPWILLGALCTISIGIVGFYSLYVLQSDGAIGAGQPERPAGVVERDEPLVTFIDPVKGAPDGDILIVEYGDHTCPFCKRAEEDIDRLIREFPDRVKFVWKDLPNPIHTGAGIAAEAAHCAKDQGRFWDFHAALFENQGVYTHTGLSLLANEVDLDLQRFGDCLSSREKLHIVERSVSEAEALGIDGTPYFFINGERYSGQLGYEELKNAALR